MAAELHISVSLFGTMAAELHNSVSLFGTMAAELHNSESGERTLRNPSEGGHLETTSDDEIRWRPRSPSDYKAVISILEWVILSWLRGYGTLKYGDVHKKFNFLEITNYHKIKVSVQLHFVLILITNYSSYLF